MTNESTNAIAVIPDAGVQKRAGAVTAEDLMPVLDLAAGLRRRNFMTQVAQQLMVSGIDYGVIPGTAKPTLLKPGAERLCTLFGVSPDVDELAVIEDWDGSGEGRGEPLFYYRYRVRLTKNGILLGAGIGSANSRESKYRYRAAERRCPKCGAAAIIKGREEYGGGWVCVVPETPILYADMVWRPIGEAKVGDEIIGFDEYPLDGSQRRKLRHSTIEALWCNKKPTQRLVTASGELFTTAEHRWLEHHLAPGYRGHWGDPWTETRHLRAGNPLRSIGTHETFTVTADYRRGYLAGMTDSDGTIRLAYEHKPYWRVALQLSDEAALGRLVAYLAVFGIETKIAPFNIKALGKNSKHNSMGQVNVRARASVAQIHTLIQPADTAAYKRGYLAGFFDGDGSGGEGRLTIYREQLEKLDRLARYGQAFGFDFQQCSSTGRVRGVRLHGGVREAMRFIATVQPALLRKAGYTNVAMQYDPTIIEAIEPGGLMDVVDIQTSTGTYFANGIATHNCFAKKGGCNAKFKDGDAFIEKQPGGRAANPDIADQVNTIQKMAHKRALIAAVLIATNASEFYTQDIEDMEIIDVAPAPSEPAPAKRRPQPAQEPAGKPWTTFKGMIDAFAALHGRLRKEDDSVYRETLKEFGVEHSNQFKDRPKALAAYVRLLERVRQCEAEYGEPPEAVDVIPPEEEPNP